MKYEERFVEVLIITASSIAFGVWQESVTAGLWWYSVPIILRSLKGV